MFVDSELRPRGMESREMADNWSKSNHDRGGRGGVVLRSVRASLLVYGALYGLLTWLVGDLHLEGAE